MQELQAACAAEEKRYVVAACHQAASTIPDTCTVPGVAERLQATQLGLARWQGLATAASVDVRKGTEAVEAINGLALRAAECLAVTQ